MAADTNAQPRPLHEIGRAIEANWTRAYFGAKPYIVAMRHLDGVDDKVNGQESGRDVVLYFLSNAKNWRGEAARTIKAELRALLDGSSS